MPSYQKSGYLFEDFRVFHLSDQGRFDVDYHYHDFHKILVLLKGSLSYSIEGRTYDLKAGDVVFVAAGEVHRPILHDDSAYERIIIYIAKDYLNQFEGPDMDLGICFHSSPVLRFPGFVTSKSAAILRDLEHSYKSEEYANSLYQHVLFLEFLIQLNRTLLKNQDSYLPTSNGSGKMASVIDYINDHLTEDLTIDNLSQTFFMSRYYLMHSFKEETGYSIGSYISTKRLLLAKDLIENGAAVTTACLSCGFRNYSTFLRAYKKQFNSIPTQGSSNVPTRYSLEVE